LFDWQLQPLMPKSLFAALSHWSRVGYDAIYREAPTESEAEAEVGVDVDVEAEAVPVPAIPIAATHPSVINALRSTIQSSRRWFADSDVR
jgi:hypothetical protein